MKCRFLTVPDSSVNYWSTQVVEHCMTSRGVCVLGVVSLLTPLFTTTLAAILASSSWDPLTYALSDLGEPSRGGVALLFNLGLIVGGMLITVYLLHIFRACQERVGMLSMLAAALFLIAVGMFNVSFGIAHTIVSACFFLALGVAVLYYMCKRRDMILAGGFVLSLTLWSTHLVLHAPHGAAIPEVVSTVVASYCYMRYLVIPICESAKKC